MGRIFSYIMENKSHVWNHQPDVKNDHFGVSPLTNPVRCYVFQWVFCPWSPRNRILIWALHDAAFWSKFLVELRGPILENHADFTWSQVWLWRGKFLETPPQGKKNMVSTIRFPSFEKFPPRSQAWSASVCSAQREPGHAHPEESKEPLVKTWFYVSAMTQWSCVYHRANPNGTSLYKYWTTPIHFAT